MTNRDIYRENGYDDRDDYLRSLADDYGVPEEAVQALADILGPDEDFDGLVSSLEDAADGGWFRESTEDDD
jgi:hypothetical protein